VGNAQRPNRLLGEFSRGLERARRPERRPNRHPRSARRAGRHLADVRSRAAVGRARRGHGSATTRAARGRRDGLGSAPSGRRYGSSIRARAEQRGRADALEFLSGRHFRLSVLRNSSSRALSNIGGYFRRNFKELPRCSGSEGEQRSACEECSGSRACGLGPMDRSARRGLQRLGTARMERLRRGFPPERDRYPA